MALIGDKPRPRLLVIAPRDSGFDNYMPVLRPLVPTIRLISPDDLLSVRQAEWDVALLFGLGPIALESNLFVIQLGGGASEQLEFPTVMARLVRGTTVATEFFLNEDLPHEIRALVRADLVPYVTGNERNEVIQLEIEGPLVAPDRIEVPNIAETVEPFLSDGDGKPVAGRFTRTYSDAEWWMIPFTGGKVDSWVSAALAVWSQAYPDKFPGKPDWQQREEWQVPAEQKAQQALQALRDRRKQILLEIDREDVVLQEALLGARAAADSSERRLLTAQGDDLVAAVRDALDELGFSVEDVDRQRAVPGDRLEDLRVTDTEEPEWIALVEVRGYAKGAQVNDLLRIGRFVTRYLRQEGRLPSAAWYVVNQHRDADPTTRPRPLHANVQEVETFAADDGAVMDTRALFTLLVEVRAGRRDRLETRRTLRSSRGVLDLTD